MLKSWRYTKGAGGIFRSVPRVCFRKSSWLPVNNAPCQLVMVVGIPSTTLVCNFLFPSHCRWGADPVHRRHARGPLLHVLRWSGNAGQLQATRSTSDYLWRGMLSSRMVKLGWRISGSPRFRFRWLHPDWHQDWIPDWFHQRLVFAFSLQLLARFTQACLVYLQLSYWCSTFCTGLGTVQHVFLFPAIRILCRAVVDNFSPTTKHCQLFAGLASLLFQLLM